MQNDSQMEIRDLSTIEDFEACIALQREAFGLPDIEISPRRHFIVTNRAGGFTLGAFSGGRMVGFVHHLVAIRDGQISGYSHMMAVARDFQNQGVGARLKWAQRTRALAEKCRFIKWTWDPMQPRNAHFNLNRLGVAVRTYAPNFYGTDYPSPDQSGIGIDSDRLFAEWELASDHVNQLSTGAPIEQGTADERIEIPADWSALVRLEPEKARAEQLRVRTAFEAAFSRGLTCRAFHRDANRPAYLLYR